MKYFNQVRKLLLSNLEDLDEQLSEITHDEYPLIHSESKQAQQHKDSTINPHSTSKTSSFNDLEKIKHAIIQIDKKNNARNSH